MEVVDERRLGEVVCPSCGSSFRLETESTAAWSPQTGQRRLGKFLLVDTVGVGAFGTVYMARDTELDRIVAIKVPRFGNLSTPEDYDRFAREARSAAQLAHPSIVALHEVGQTEGIPYLVSEFVRGTTLADQLSVSRPSFRVAAEWVATIADALDYAHRQGIIHRDVKPSNIMIGEDGVPRLMDFGLAKREAGEITMTLDGQVLGTPAYMSPEQAAGATHAVDGRTDVYSLGVVLYELLTGELPFRGTKRMLIHQVMHDEPRSLRRLNDRIPRDLETICLKAMAKEPHRRFSTAGAMAADLRCWLEGKPIEARPVSRLERLWRWCRRNPGLASLTSAVALLLLSVGIGGVAVALHLGRLADEERALRADADAARTAAETALANEEAARKQAEAARRAAEEAKRLETVERQRAQALAQANRRSLYAAQINLAQQEWEQGNVARAIELLSAQWPKPGEEDLRGFEWAYLWQLCHGAELTLDAAAGPVRAVAFSPDGKAVASVGGRAGLLWSASSGELIDVYPLPEGAARCVAFAPDGKSLAIGGGEVGRGGRVSVWNLEERRRLFVIDDLADPVMALAYAPDGQTLATGTAPLAHGWGNPLTRLVWIEARPRNGEVRIWDAASGKRLAIGQGESNGILSLAYSPDGRQLAAGGWDAKVRLFGIDGSLQEERTGFTSNVWSVAYLGDGTLVAGGGKWDGAPELKAWRSRSRDVQESFRTAHARGITALAVVPGTSTLVTGSWDRSARLYDVQTGKETERISGQGGYLSAVAAAPDGQRIATAGLDGTVKLWLRGGRPDQTKIRGWYGSGYCVSFSSDGRWLATTRNDVILVWNLSAGRLEVGLPGHNGQTLAAFSPDGRWLATAGIGGATSPRARLYDTGTWNGRDLEGHEHTVWSIAFSADSRWLATGSQDRTLRLWDVEAAQTAAVFEGGLGGTVRSVAFHPSGRWLAAAVHVAGEGKSAVKLFDLQTRKDHRIIFAHQHNIECVAFSPDGQTLATCSHDTTAKLFDVATWTERATLSGHTEPIYHLTFSKDGRTLATAGWDGNVRLWSVATGQPLLTLAGHVGTVWNVAFAPEGTTLAVGSSYQEAAPRVRRRFELTLWHAADVQRAEEQLSYDERTKPHQILARNVRGLHALAAAPDGANVAYVANDTQIALVEPARRATRIFSTDHRDLIRHISFNHDGTLLATGSWEDDSVRVWKTADGKLLRTLPSTGPVRALAFSPTANQLAIGLQEPATEIVVWNVEDGRPLARWKGHTATVSALTFSPDGGTLYSGSWDCAVKSWHWAPARQQWSQATSRWGVTAIAVAPDGRLIAGGGGFGDPAIRIYDRDTGAQLGALLGHCDEIIGITFSHDGRLLVSAAHDGSIRFWDPVEGRLLHTLPSTGTAIIGLAPFGRSEKIVSASANGTVALWDLPAADARRRRAVRAEPRRQLSVPDVPDIDWLAGQRRWKDIVTAARERPALMAVDRRLSQYLGEAYWQLGAYPAAAEAIRMHLDRCPSCAWGLARLTQCYLALEQYEPAQKLLEEQVAARPDQARPRNDLAWLLVTTPPRWRNAPRALELAEKAVQLEPKNASYLNTLGVACYRSGQYDRAIEVLRRAVELGGDEPSAFDAFFLAMAYQQRKEPDTARQWYDRATQWLAKNPNLPKRLQSELEQIRQEADTVLGRRGGTGN